ncbi:hypothetical protein [Haladaptatus sp. DFWS20]|uniref:hypothetical protein n=1 Tax=Haladaptatus sp. DFWS20 TaxID=3403467 RepID=UPI003EBB1ACA
MQNGTMMGGENGTMMGGQNGTMLEGQGDPMMGGQNGTMMGEHQGEGEPPEDAIRVTPQVAEKGAVQMLAFVATRDVARYICTVHPSTMVGDVTVRPDQGNSGGQHGDNGNHGDEGESDNTGSHAHG